MWVGTYGGGLARIDLASDRVVRYSHGHVGPTSLIGDRVTALAVDRDGLIWIGTDGDGLDMLDPSSGQVVRFVNDPGDPGSLSAYTVYALHTDIHGALWIGTRGGGLDHAIGRPVGGERVKFQNISEADGLPNNVIFGIESDDSGTLWLSTLRGLASVRSDGRIHSFRKNNGLQSDEFNFGAHYRAPDGTLYFGGPHGYNAFQPKHLKLNTTRLSPVLTDVLILNSRAAEDPSALTHLDLGYRDTMVSLQFTTLDFTDPDSNRYEYKLAGYDQSWVDADTRRSATYTHLPGGDYHFLVRAVNSEGARSERPLELSVHVATPPWASGWARAIYAIAASGALVVSSVGPEISNPSSAV
jgi:streptogramin lyase